MVKERKRGKTGSVETWFQGESDSNLRSGSLPDGIRMGFGWEI